jgi:hypothetical protein
MTGASKCSLSQHRKIRSDLQPERFTAKMNGHPFGWMAFLQERAADERKSRPEAAHNQDYSSVEGFTRSCAATPRR